VAAVSGEVALAEGMAVAGTVARIGMVEADIGPEVGMGGRIGTAIPIGGATVILTVTTATSRMTQRVHGHDGHHGHNGADRRYGRVSSTRIQCGPSLSVRSVHSVH
jgi:hypothetical protein